MKKSNMLSAQPAIKYSLPAPAILQRKCECGTHTPAGGECEACGKEKGALQRKTAAGAATLGSSPPSIMQAKLSIGASDDPLEREADQAVDQLPAAQAYLGAGEAPPRIQRFTGQSTEGKDTAPARVDCVPANPGSPMEPVVRQDMEQRFVNDFSRVRVHSGSTAEQSARDLNASAYTVGQDIVFGADRLVPASRDGRQLTAQELTHVGQSNERRGPTPNRRLTPIRIEPRFGDDLTRVQGHTEQTFPHRADIERGFGIPVPGSAVIDTMECGRRGVHAFTEHLTTHFATKQPNLKVAAHEAAHLAQHAALTYDANLGAEGHADAVARSIVQSGSARSLIAARGSRVLAAVRPYTEVPTSLQSPLEWDAKMDLRVSKDARMAVGQDSAMHSLWAESSLIGQSNSTLTSRKSVIRLHELPDKLTGTTPGSSGTHTLSKVSPHNVANSTSGETMNIWADCGKSGRDVMGAGKGTGEGSMKAAFREQKKPWYASIPILGPLLGAIFGVPGSASDPKKMKQEIFNEKLGGTGDEGLKKYQSLPGTEKERFDKETGINRFAAPKVGEGYTMSSGGPPVPGNRTWNFHWGGVVMLSGDDRATLENYAVGNPAVQNSDWEFQMYGSADQAGQTFHEQHQATGQHGDAPTTMQVEKN